jgi:putative hydrolase of HD superfamily
MKTTIKIIEDFLKLQSGYQFTHRNLMTKERFKNVALADVVRGLDIEDLSLREPLIEHIGHLPITASYFHQFLEHKNEVDLGRVLTMLSIHDIGETLVGDVFAYTKTKAEEEAETRAALTLLPDYLQIYFLEYEERETLDARYAKSVDAFAGFLPTLDMPHIIIERFKKNGATVQDIVNRKRLLMEWDTTMLQLFDVSMEQAFRAERGEELIFDAVDYDLKRTS